MGNRIGLDLAPNFGRHLELDRHRIRTFREEVRVNDLLTGRDFKARSFLDLLGKEHAIRKMSVAFANVVDQARTRHEPEVIELEPQPLFPLLESERATV